MANEALNKTLLSGNECYGCGHENFNGLRIEIYRHPSGGESLVGTFDPDRHLVGYPGVIHGGPIYSALDCMAAWTPTVLRPEMKAFWVLRTASIKYLRPARPDRPISLSSVIEQEGKQWEPMVIRAEARDPENNLVAEGSFRVIPLPPEKFRALAALGELPENYSRFLGEME